MHFGLVNEKCSGASRKNQIDNDEGVSVWTLDGQPISFAVSHYIKLLRLATIQQSTMSSLHYTPPTAKAANKLSN